MLAALGWIGTVLETLIKIGGLVKETLKENGPTATKLWIAVCALGIALAGFSLYAVDRFQHIETQQAKMERRLRVLPRMGIMLTAICRKFNVELPSNDFEERREEEDK